MAKLPIRWIEARAYCHSTEDEARVLQALDFACPTGETSREPLEGHVGNPLVRLTRRVDNAKEIRTIWDRWIGAGLPGAISGDVDARVDEDGVLHFRLAKQAAFQERLELAKDADSIDVRLKLIAYPAKVEQARRVARSIVPETM
jgi:RNA binding exosome subunit